MLHGRSRRTGLDHPADSANGRGLVCCARSATLHRLGQHGWSIEFEDQGHESVLVTNPNGWMAMLKWQPPWAG
jgi:hypothetical protein